MPTEAVELCTIGSNSETRCMPIDTWYMRKGQVGYAIACFTDGGNKKIKAGLERATAESDADRRTISTRSRGNEHMFPRSASDWNELLLYLACQSTYA